MCLINLLTITLFFFTHLILTTPSATLGNFSITSALCPGTISSIAEYFFVEKEKKELEIVLLDASQRYKIFHMEFPTLEQLIQQYHIASYLGISATQLSRIRHQLSVTK